MHSLPTDYMKQPLYQQMLYLRAAKECRSINLRASGMVYLHSSSPWRSLLSFLLHLPQKQPKTGTVALPGPGTAPVPLASILFESKQWVTREIGRFIYVSRSRDVTCVRAQGRRPANRKYSKQAFYVAP